MTKSGLVVIEALSAPCTGNGSKNKNDDVNVLQVLADLCGLLCLTSTTTSTSSTDSAVTVPTVTLKQVHPLCPSIVSRITTRGWTACIRAICANSLLWPSSSSNMNALEESLVESWIQASSTVLLPSLEHTTDEAATAAAAEAKKEFMIKLEHHFFNNDQTYLVGTSPTAADVVVALWIVLGCCHDDDDDAVVQQQTHRWLTTICKSNPILENSISTYSLPTCGQLSPLEKTIKKKKEEAAPAVVIETTRKKVVLPKIETKQEATAPTPTPTPTNTTETAPPPPATTTQTVITSSNNNNVILDTLLKFGIEFHHYTHAMCMTAEELVTNVKLDSEQESHTKNLFLKDKKHGMILVTAKPDTQVSTKALGGLLGFMGKTNFRLASPQDLEETLGVKPGCVGPLSLINDVNHHVQLVLDQELLKCSKIHSHPLFNTMSVSMTPASLQQYLKMIEAKVAIVDFGSSSSSSSAPAGDSSKSGGTTRDGEYKKKEKNADKKTSKKGETLLALQWKKDENFAMWYSDVIVLSEMIAYYDISGCYILRPWSYKIWELIQEWFNEKIQALGVENSYFPLFVSQDRLEKEKDHVEGFAPEVAWVTKSGDTELAKHIAIRPTSETIMYPAFSDWIKSHRDLPLKLNQWSNVVRWEFKYPTPFLRSREFLWQEGHTVHTSIEDADEMVMQALDLYRGVYEDLLAVPVIKGYKTEKEKFAGGYRTTTCEAYISGSGRAIQGATSHNLGQNFGKMFDITYQDEKGNSQIAWQTSWGLTTRTIGVMVMVHGDDTGLVMPPRVSPLQAVIVAIVSKKLTVELAGPYCEAILEDLKANGIRAKYDDRDMYTPGWKYNHWEQKGVPIRIEVGPRDIEQKQARLVIRYNGDKIDVAVDGLGASIKTKLEEIQTAMFTKAKEIRDHHVAKITEWKDFVPNLEKNNLVLTPWCGGEHTDWEDWVKEKSREESLQSRGEAGEDERTATSLAAKTLCIPFDQPPIPEGTKCIASDIPATCWILWGRSY